MHIDLTDYRSLLITYLKPQSSRVGILALLLCGDIALQLVNPQLLRMFIDGVSSSGVLTVLLFQDWCASLALTAISLLALLAINSVRNVATKPLCITVPSSYNAICLRAFYNCRVPAPFLRRPARRSAAYAMIMMVSLGTGLILLLASSPFCAASR